MNDLLPFLMQHWPIALLFVVVLIAIFSEEYRSHTGGGARLEPQQAVERMNHEDAVVLDLRNGEAFKKGHIINAINITANDLPANLTKLEKYKNKPLIVVCQNGTHSSKVVLQLKKQGFTQLYLVGGGIEAWKRDNLPLVN